MKFLFQTCLLWLFSSVYAALNVSTPTNNPIVNKTIFKIDPDSREEYWNSIKDSKIVKTITFHGKENAVNYAPNGRYLKVNDIPNGDVLVHTGDFSNHGDLDEIIEYNDLLGKLPHKHKLVLAGNHELGFDTTENLDTRDPKWAGARDRGTRNGQLLIKNATYLQDQAYEIDGVKFYGAPWHPLRGYPFYKARGSAMEEVWAKIPNDTDVLLTHSPALGYLDTFGTERWGCRDLLERIEIVKPKFHVFGHIHERFGAASNGVTDSNLATAIYKKSVGRKVSYAVLNSLNCKSPTRKMTFINAAQCNKKNKLHNKPVVLFIPLP